MGEASLEIGEMLLLGMNGGIMLSRRWVSRPVRRLVSILVQRPSEVVAFLVHRVLVVAV
jgi:hypothetical protein